MFGRLAPALAFVVGFAAQETARAQCGTWETKFNPLGINAEVRAVVSWNDGSGPGVYIGGSFTRTGNVPATHVAKWDGSAWHALGTGLPDTVDELCVFDDGSGQALYAAGGLTVKRWNGFTWRQVGGVFSNTGGLNAFAVFDEGNGPHLFVGGSFTLNNGQTIRSVARWDGAAWTAVGSGVGTPNFIANVHDMCVFDDGNGPALFVGGSFPGNDTIACPDLMRWNGTSWSAVGGGVHADNFQYVTALGTFDDGSGPALAVAGLFSSISGVPASNVARWDGQSFSAMGVGLPTLLYDLVTLPGRNGDELIATGSISTTQPTNYRGSARWNGTTWETLGGPGITVQAAAVHDGGQGPRLIAVGTFTNAPANRIAEYDGSSWLPLSDGLGANGTITSFASFDDGSGPGLFVGGSFNSVGSLPVKGLARWDGNAWSALSSTVNASIRSMLVWDDGSGPALIAGGVFGPVAGDAIHGIARWTGTTWTNLGLGIGSATPFDIVSVDALAAFDDGGGTRLYAGGNFNNAGGATAVGIARWDGSDWSDLAIGVNGPVLDMLAWNDGSGPALYVCGDFTNAGGVAANRIAKWDGSAWSALGSGAPNGNVKSLVVFDDGSGAKLYAGGSFSSMGGVASNGLARWNASAWSDVAHGNFGVQRMRVADLGDGPDLLVSSGFSLHRRVNNNWIELATFNGGANALHLFDSEGDGRPDVYVGGSFGTLFSATLPSSAIAVYRGCTQTAESFCFGDGLATACPCGNSGDIGHGCENSTLSGGALLTANGVASVSNDSLRLDCSGVPTNTTTLFVQATGQANGGIGSVLGDGLLCISGAVLRIGTPFADGETASVGFGTGSQALSIKGQIPQAGATRHYQVRYRNVASYCTSATFNQSNGASIVWAP